MTVMFFGMPKLGDEDAADEMKSKMEFAVLKFNELWLEFCDKSEELRKPLDDLIAKFSKEEETLKAIYQTAKHQN